jgi:hypothetical protein
MIEEQKDDVGNLTGQSVDKRRRLVMLAASFALVSCGGGGGGDSPAPPTPAAPNPPAPNPPAPNPPAPNPPAPNPPAPNPPAPPASGPTPPPPPATAKSAKRGIAYDLASAQDFQALSAGTSWWYNWSSTPNGSAPSNTLTAYAMGYVPMLWNANYDAPTVEAYLKAHPDIQYLMVLNEPNLTDQSNLTPAQAAAAWPGYEAVAAATGVKIVGPQMTWGTMAGYSDPVVWLDAFYAAYRAANGGRDPRIDVLAFHWYDYGLGDQLDRLAKYGKPFWVTEFANWHVGDGSAAIDTLAKQQAQMTDMVNTCETRTDVLRYAWFTGRWNNDVHFTSLFNSGAGSLTALGTEYIGLPFTAS